MEKDYEVTLKVTFHCYPDGVDDVVENMVDAIMDTGDADAIVYKNAKEFDSNSIGGDETIANGC